MKIKVLISILCILCSSGISYSQVLMGEGISKAGSMIQIGPLKIPWSKANFHYGYIYGIEGLSFANISSKPSRWLNRGSYKSYQGVKRIEDVNQNSNLNFSFSPMLVFSNASEPSITDHRGILLFRYKGLFGAIDFIRIDENGLYYKYWINTKGGYQFTKPPSQGIGSRPLFNTNEIHEYNIHHEFQTLEITGGNNFIFNSGLTITQSLKITDGQLIIQGEKPLYVKNIEISERGTLIIQGNSTVFVSGDWINNGTFLPQTESIIFNGNIPQKISGNAQFYSLEIDTNSIVEASAISAQVLSIHSGVFTPGNDSIFTHVFIGDRGVFCPAWQASVSVLGNIANDGNFYHNNGTIILNGSDRQDIDMRNALFFNLIIGQNVFFRNPPMAESQIIVKAGGIWSPEFN